MEAARKLERALQPRAMKPQQIREAAARLFQEQGYGAVSMDAIARAAGVSKATIYAHFADKAELFEELMKAACREEWVAVTMLDAEPGDLRAELHAIGKAYAEFLVDPRAVRIYRMVLAESPRFPELGRAFFEGGPRLITDKLTAYLARAEAQGKLALGGASNRAAQNFLAMLRCEPHLRALLGLDEAAEMPEIASIVDSATDMFLRAYGR
jgi:TetR/AcrR family transcriptional regulator, mexJK operon transcriptional repressor